MSHDPGIPGPVWDAIEERLCRSDPANGLESAANSAVGRARLAALKHAAPAKQQTERGRVWLPRVGAALGVVAVMGVVAGLFLFGPRKGLTPATDLPDWARISLLDRPATPADRLPKNLPPGIETDSARLAASTPTTRIWLAKGTDRRALCLIVEPTGTNYAPRIECFSRQAFVLFGAAIKGIQSADGSGLTVGVVPDGVVTVQNGGRRAEVSTNVFLLNASLDAAGSYTLRGPNVVTMRAQTPGFIIAQRHQQEPDAVDVVPMPTPLGPPEQDGRWLRPPLPALSLPLLAPGGTGPEAVLNLEDLTGIGELGLFFPGAQERPEIPALLAKDEEFQSDHLRLVVAVRESRQSLSRWAERVGVGWPILLDEEGKLADALGMTPGRSEGIVVDGAGYERTPRGARDLVYGRAAALGGRLPAFSHAANAVSPPDEVTTALSRMGQATAACRDRPQALHEVARSAHARLFASSASNDSVRLVVQGDEMVAESCVPRTAEVEGVKRPVGVAWIEWREFGGPRYIIAGVVADGYTEVTDGERTMPITGNTFIIESREPADLLTFSGLGMDPFGLEGGPAPYSDEFLEADVATAVEVVETGP